MLDYAKVVCGVKLLTTSNECKKPSDGQQKEIPDFKLQDCQAMIMACTKSCFEKGNGKLEAEHSSIPTSRGNRAKQNQCESRNGHETSQTQKEEEEVIAEFSYLSDTDDSAVEDLISQTKDLYVLEQNATINGSSFTVDGSLLPSHLESRFCKLKSFTLSKPQTTLLNFEQSQDGVDARIRLRGRRNFLAIEVAES
ncbi:hypothetical protein NL676_020107 [Syzygium grande]|nr:hypothetical protein NL676_020107 [Syzygium grande]